LSKNDLDAVEIAQKQRHLYLLNQVKNNRHLSQRELKELKKLEDKAKSKKKIKPKRKAAAFADAEIIKTQANAAKYAGKSVRTIRRWVKAGMPRTESGHYIKAMLDFYKINEGNQPTEAKKRSQDADAGIKEKKDKLLQLQLEEKQRDFDAELERALVQRIPVIKRPFLGMGRKLAPQLANIRDERKIQRIINDEVRDIIRSFSE
jgi:hypothetical protein